MCMKRPLFILCLTCESLVLLCSFSCSLRKSEPITGKTVNRFAQRTARGEKIFMMYCYKCHPGGEAGLGPAVFYKPGFMKRFQVRHGMGVMPAFKASQISRDDLRDIVFYLKKKQAL